MASQVNYYVAVFIDLLGQGEKLSKMNKLPQTEMEKDEFRKLYLETAGTVTLLHKTFDGFFEAFNGVTSEGEKWFESLSDELKEVYYDSKKINLKYLNFSDTVVLYFSIDRESNKFPMKSVYSALSSTAATFLIMLSTKIPLRGAINIGTGTELEKSGIYGQILHNLHYLESKIAEYPRIIIGNELLEMIEEFDKEEIRNGDTIQIMNKNAISSIKELIKIDDDGENVLNYLAPSISSSLEAKKEIYIKLKNFVDEKCSLFKGIEKLSKRYNRLRKFIRKNKSHWM